MKITILALLAFTLSVSASDAGRRAAGDSLPPREHMARRGDATKDWAKHSSSKMRMARQHRQRAHVARGQGVMPAMGLTSHMVGVTREKRDDVKESRVVRKRAGKRATETDAAAEEFDFKFDHKRDNRNSPMPVAASQQQKDYTSQTGGKAAATNGYNDAGSSNTASPAQATQTNDYNDYSSQDTNDYTTSSSKAAATGKVYASSTSTAAASDYTGSTYDDNTSGNYDAAGNEIDSSSSTSTSTGSGSSSTGTVSSSNSSGTTSSSTDTSSTSTDDEEDCEEDEDDTSASTTSSASTSTSTGTTSTDDNEEDCDDSDEDDSTIAVSVGSNEQQVAGTSAASSSSSSAPKSTGSSSSSGTVTTSGNALSGTATWYEQKGVAGACGTVAQDSDKVVALYTSDYSGGSNCGKMVQLTNIANGKTVTATVRDECPSCEHSGNIDLSVGTFTALGVQSQGVLSVKWSYIS